MRDISADVISLSPNGMRGWRMATVMSQTSLAISWIWNGTSGEEQNWGEKYSESGSVRAEREVPAGYPHGEDCSWAIQIRQILRHGGDVITRVREMNWAAPQRKKNWQICSISQDKPK